MKLDVIALCGQALIALVAFFVIAVSLVCIWGCSANQFYVMSNVEKEIGTAEVSNEMMTKISNEMETVISSTMETVISNYMKTLISAADIGQGNTAGDMGVGVKTGDNTVDAEANMKKKEVNK